MYAYKFFDDCTVRLYFVLIDFDGPKSVVFEFLVLYFKLKFVQAVSRSFNKNIDNVFTVKAE